MHPFRVWDTPREVRVSKSWRWLFVMVAVVVSGAFAVAAWFHLSKPTTLKIAVGPAGFADAELIGAFSRTLNANKSSVRLTVEPATGPTDALGKLIKGEADLAVVRADGAPSERLRAVSIVHTDPVV